MTQKTPQKTPLHTTRDFLSRDVLTFCSYQPPSTDLLSTTPISASKRDDRPSPLPPPFPDIQHPRSLSIEHATTHETAHLKLLDTLFLRHVLTFVSCVRHLPSLSPSTPFSPFETGDDPSLPPPPPRAHFTSRQIHKSAVKNYAVKPIMTNKKIRV